MPLPDTIDTVEVDCLLPFRIGEDVGEMPSLGAQTVLHQALDIAQNAALLQETRRDPGCDWIRRGIVLDRRCGNRIREGHFAIGTEC